MKIPAAEVKKIAIFRALQLGDMLCSIPAIRALKGAYPQALITLLGLPWAKSLTERFPGYFDQFIHFPGYPGLPEQQFHPRIFTKFLEEVQAQEFDLVLQMQGNGTIVNPMVVLFGGKYTAGFCVKHDFCPDPNYFLEYPEGISEIERHIRLMHHLGIASNGTDLEFPVTEAEEKEMQAIGLPIQKHNYVCVHPGSRGSWRQWPPECFARLADYCASTGLKVVITGTKDEQEIVQQVLQHMKSDALNAAGKTGLGAVGALIKNAKLLISNCTGVSHLAAASKTKSIVISMDGEPERWGPLNKKLHRTIDWLKTPDYDLVLKETVSLLSE
jgi:ADP-heptose:LPS heptosyltransferase